MRRWRLKSPALLLFTQPFIRAQIKENIKAPRNWPLWGPATQNIFPFDDEIMTKDQKENNILHPGRDPVHSHQNVLGFVL